MKEKLAKRLLFFSRVILLVWLVAIAVWLQKLDSYELREDVRDLNLLVQLRDVPRAEELRRLRGPTFHRAAEWLAEVAPQVSDARVDVRKRFSRWLHEEGVPSHQLGLLSGKLQAPRDQPLPFYFMRVDGEEPWLPAPDQEASSFPAPDDDRSHDAPPSPSTTTVADYLDELNRLAAPIQLTCAVAVDESEFSSQHLLQENDFESLDDLAGGFPPPPGGPDGMPEGPPLDVNDEPPGGHPVAWRDFPENPFLPVPFFMSAELFGKEVHTRYTVHHPDSDPMPMQMTPQTGDVRSLPISVQTSTVGDTTLLYLSDAVPGEHDSMVTLYESADRKSYLRRTYGHLPISSAVALANDGLTQAYRSVSMFGFTCSTRRFPFAVLALVAFALLGTLSTLRIAHREAPTLLSDLVDDYALDLLLANVPARMLVWMILPLSSLWVAIPLVPLTDLESICLVSGVFVASLTGAACTYSAARLQVPAVDSGGDARSSAAGR